jgi:RND family efflux transporter MFP subunit
MKAVTLFSLIVALFIMGCAGKKNEQQINAEKTEIPIQTAAIEFADKQQSARPIAAQGMLASDQEARLAFKTGGIIATVNVREGQNVSKGQVLATLNLTEINAQVAQAIEGVQKAERDLKRVQNLYKDSVATLEQMQNANTALELARRNVEIAQYNRAYSEIKAPGNGVILKKLMNEGELASPGMPVLFMSGNQQNAWKIIVSMADKDWIKVRTGDSADIYFDALGNDKYKGIISIKGQGADPRNGLYQAEIIPAGIWPAQIASGLFARVNIHSHGHNAGALAIIPVDALIEGNGTMAYIFAEKNNKAIKIPVQVQYVQNGKAAVQADFNGISSVITKGSAYLNDGVPVRIVR